MEIGWSNSGGNSGNGSSLATILGMGANAPGTNPSGPYPTQPAPNPGTVNGGQVDPVTGRPPGVVPPTGGVNSPVAGGGHQNATVSGQPAASGGAGYRDSNGYYHADPHWTAAQQAAYEKAMNGYLDTSGKVVAPNHDAAQQINDASWVDYDHRRAFYAGLEQEARLRWKASLTKDQGVGVDAPVYDPDTNTYSYRDKDGKWYHGTSAADIYSKLNSDVQKQYPEWYFGQYADQQLQNTRSNLDANAYTNMSFAKMGQQATRYQSTNL